MSLNSNISSKQSNALNADVLNPLSIILPSSPLNPSKISYYQSPQNISAPNTSNPLDYLNQPSSGNEFNSCNIQNGSYNNGEECETPKMPVNVEQNNELLELKILVKMIKTIYNLKPQKNKLKTHFLNVLKIIMKLK